MIVPLALGSKSFAFDAASSRSVAACRSCWHMRFDAAPLITCDALMIRWKGCSVGFYHGPKEFEIPKGVRGESYDTRQDCDTEVRLTRIVSSILATWTSVSPRKSPNNSLKKSSSSPHCSIASSQSITSEAIDMTLTMAMTMTTTNARNNKKTQSQINRQRRDLPASVLECHFEFGFEKGRRIHSFLFHTVRDQTVLPIHALTRYVESHLLVSPQKKRME